MPDDTAVILYTSGTTGRPKGAELSHFNLLFNAEYMTHLPMPYAPQDAVVMVVLPLFHSFGQTVMQNATVRGGGTMVLMPRFEPVAAAQLIAKHQVKFFAGVPTMYFALLNHPEVDPAMLASVKHCASGGAAMPVEVMNAFDKKFSQDILEGYGLSETSPVASFNPPGAKKHGSIGKPIWGVEFRLVDGEGKVVTTTDTPGEIQIKGHNVMKGYWKRPEATAESIQDGWFHTGDVGTRDSDGFYYIVDRKKDMIIRGGFNVYPREIEEVLYAHPAVLEAAVVGIPHESHGEEVKAVLALKPGSKVTAEEIIAYCKEKLAAYKYPRGRRALPKARPAILKRELGNLPDVGDPSTGGEDRPGTARRVPSDTSARATRGTPRRTRGGGRPAGVDATMDSRAGPGAAGTAGPAAARVTLPPVDPGHYEVETEHARGGLGRIMRARDKRTGRLVALKEIITDHPITLARFAREALVTANLQHPAIVPVYEVGRWPTGAPFFAMKLVAGRPLDEVLDEATSLAQRMAMLPRIIVIADAMAYAHGQGVIHRDLKPANVLVGDFGETVLIDWGLARRVADVDDDLDDASVTGLAAAAGAAANATVMGAVVGTPAYMPPEQAMGEPVDERADVYALGAILYHVLAGHAPFADRKSPSLEELLARVMREPPTPLATVVPGAPSDLLAIVRKAMARERDDRYATARELAEELGRFQTGQLVGAHRYSRRERLRRWLKKHRAPVAVGAVAMVLLAIGGSLAVSRVLRERDRAQAGEVEAARQRNVALAAQDEARARLADALFQKGGERERALRWDQAAAYYAAAATQDDRADARWAAAIAEARAIVPLHQLDTGSAAHAVAVAPDGLTIAAGSEDGVVRRWRPADGTRLPDVAIDVPVHALAFAPDGRTLAVGDEHGTIHLLDLASGRITGTRAGHTARIWALDYAPDGRLVSAGEDTLITVWGATSTPVTLRGHSQRVYDVAVAPDGSSVVSVSDDRTIRAWSLDGGAGAIMPGTFTAGIKTVAWIDGRQVVSSGWELRLRFIEVAAAREIAQVANEYVTNAVVTSPDGRLLAVGGDDPFITLLDVATRRPVARLDAAGASVLSLAFSPDGSTLAAAGKDGKIRCWNTSGARRLVQSLGHRSFVRRLLFDPTGTRLFTEALDGTVRAWDLQAGVEIWRFADPRSCDHALALAAGKVYVGCVSQGNIFVLDAVTGDVLSRWISPPSVAALDVTGAGDVIAVGGDHDHDVRLLDGTTGALIGRLQGHTHTIYAMAFTPDGRYLASGGLDQSVRRWRREGATWVADALDEAHDDDVLATAISHDGRVVASVGETPRVRVWWPDDPGRSVWLDGHTSRIWWVALSPDARHVLSASEDGTIRVWDIATSRELRAFRALDETGQGVAVSADGTQIAGGFTGGMVVVWDFASGEIRNAFGQEASRLAGGSCTAAGRAGLDAETRGIVERACAMDPSAHLAHVLSLAELELDGVDLVDVTDAP